MPLFGCFGMGSLAAMAHRRGRILYYDWSIHMTKQGVKGKFCVPDKSVPDGVLIYEETQKSGSIQQILVPNENVCLT
jgi:hypothetical protein